MTSTYRPDSADTIAIDRGCPFATVNVITDEVTGRFSTPEAAEAFLHAQGWWATNVVTDDRTGYMV